MWAIGGRSVPPEVDLIHVVSTYLNRAVTTKLQQLTEKPPHFCEGFSSLFSVWWSLRDSNPLPPACKAGALPAELKPQTDTLL